MKWGFLLGGVVVQSDRPEVKDDVSDVIVSEFPSSMLNVSYARKTSDSYGQITSCAGRPGHDSSGYWTDSENSQKSDETLHRFDKITAGDLTQAHRYDDAHCNAQIMHLLASHPECAGFAAAHADDDDVTAVHSKYLIPLGDKTFVKATETLIQTSFVAKERMYACGYLMGPKEDNGYFHLWQYFRAATADETSEFGKDDNSFEIWKKAREAAHHNQFKWIKLSNLVNQHTPRFFPGVDPTPAATSADADTSGDKQWDDTLVSMRAMQDSWYALWVFCSGESSTDTVPVVLKFLPDSDTIKRMVFSEQLSAGDQANYTYHPGFKTLPEMHGLIVSEKPISRGEEVKNCRNTRMQVLFSVTLEDELAATQKSYLIHYEYEIPAVHHLLFEHAIFTYLKNAQNVVHGFLMSNNKEWNGFNYYHIGIVLNDKEQTDPDMVQSDPAWQTFEKTRGEAATLLGADWIKLDDHSNRKSPVLKKKLA